MSVESVKLRMAMDAARDAGDIARLYALANHCLTMLSAMMTPRNSLANYTTVVPSTDGGWLELCEGTRDRCEGYAEAYETGDDSYGSRWALVVCGKFVVWPAEHWGKELPKGAGEWSLMR